jgi:Fur family ferric uptake transcriptional regulator
MKNDIPEQIDETFRQYLHSVRMKNTEQRRVVLRVFFRMTKPLSAAELLYPVKEEEVSISFGAVYRVLKLLAACGLAHETLSTDGVVRYAHDLTETCRHAHLVCKECGAPVDLENPIATDLQAQKGTQHA